MDWNRDVTAAEYEWSPERTPRWCLWVMECVGLLVSLNREDNEAGNLCWGY